jgi:AcrR family transcriptional regulator
MPKIVDHDSRRIDLANAAGRIVAERGLENTTVRDIAHEAGFSSSILAHYFRDKDDVLAHTLRLLDERTGTQFSPDVTGEASIEEVIEAGMSVDEPRATDYRIRIHFWARALASPDLAEQQGKSFRAWIRDMRSLLRVRQKRGEVNENVEIDSTADVLMAVGIGVGVISVFLPKRSRRAFVHRVVSTATRALLHNTDATNHSSPRCTGKDSKP